ncbi:Ig-like domain-containing protein [Glaciibacter sp. 2TAF33]|uniref:Ig-like domain-containing protein n=1 Tax=Glaciibacter sp. 2TAF33 TaxID=3233015 RepID=UPI003F9266BC
MIRRWVTAHRSVVATATSGTVIAALIATIAVVSGGYTAQRLDLGDAAVWVTNQQRQVVGRANTAVHELNTVVGAGGSNIDLVQDGANVLVVDRGNSSLGIMDPATAKITENVPLPPESPAVYLGPNRAVIASNGDMWSLPVDQLPSFDSLAKPALSLGTGSVSSMDASGVYYSFSPATGDLSRVDTATGDAVVSTTTVKAGAPDDTYQLTSVAGRWALLNRSSSHLFLAGSNIGLSGLIGDESTAVLQGADTAGDRVLIAHRGGLVAVPVSGGTARELVTGRAGVPAAPTTVGNCSFAAWGDGTVWRSCGQDRAGTTTTLAGLAGDARLEFRRNGTGLLLNDAQGGAAWAVQQDNELINNWAELIDSVQDQQVVEDNKDDSPPEFEKTQVPPVAVDDDFGARPGRSVILPVLLNDYDPNGDVLVITDFDALPVDQGRLDLVGNNQQVRLTLPAAASGRLSFGYTVSDGRGGSASATAVVTIRTADENSPPAQMRVTRATVQAGGRVTTEVLGDWVDPDSDPFYLTAAIAAAPDSAGFTPDGSVVYTDAGGGGDLKQVGLIASDGRAEGSGSLSVTVRPSGSVPIIAESFVVLASAGSEVTVSPLGHVRGGSAALRLSSVPSKPDVAITPDFDGGTFRFTSNTVGTHYIDYAVTDGQITATGYVRVDVTAVSDANLKPVTVPHTAFVRGQRASVVDVLATDRDPAGGVLLVTGTMNVPTESGLRVEILDQRTLRLTLTRPLENSSVEFNYRVSNGLSEADGTVTVIELPEPLRKQAPVASADAVSVRVGDAISIPVLANDEHPDGDPLTLNPKLATPLPTGSGLLFAADNELRYLAPSHPGNFTAVYQVDAPDGQFASAQVSISVREADAESNNPPVPKTVVARVLAGDSVRIPIPLTGIDPDGDSVQLLGQETNPEKGSVTLVRSDSIEYRSGDYSAGTDTFTYSVIDALGARATGTVRVGISPRLDGARNPVAVEDEVTARPGGTVSVRVLANDSDPDGSPLSVIDVTPTGKEGAAKIDGDLVVVTAPKVEGRYGFIYEIQNTRGGTSSNFLTIVVREDAPLSRPDARDSVLSLSDILGRKTIDVDVLANVFFADSSARALGLSVLPGYAANAQVTSTKRIRVTIADNSQIIPFAVTHPDDRSVVSYALIWVPGFNDALPQLRKGAPKLSVSSESTLAIDINKYVVAVGDKKVRLTDESTVRATHADGAKLVTDAGTLAFTSADKYFGPASISFEVTDGLSATDPNGRTATIVLPIDVTPRLNQPPSFDGAVIDFEPAQSKVIDLLKLTTYPYPDDQRELTYSVLEPLPTGFTWSQNGQQLTITANESTAKGTQSALTIGVRDGINPGRAGRIEMRVVASTRPLAAPAADAAIAPRGTTTTVDVLANDSATNPFPAVPLTVLAVRGLDSAGLPAGVSITPSADKSTLSVRVAADAAPVDTNLQYQVADATGDPERYAWGTVRISVQDKPDPVSNVRVTRFGDKTLSVTFNPGAANNSPISGYQVTLLNTAGNPVGTTTCQATACDVATPGNGQANAVRVSVAAQNGIGLSAPSALADPVWSDVVPVAPTGLAAAPLDGALRLSWKPVGAAGGGSPVRGYVVTVGGNQLSEVSATGPACSAASCSIDVPGLANGVDTTYTVSARNEAYAALSAWNSSQGTGRPFGPPRPGGLTATGTDSTGTVTVAWDAFDGQGDPILGYFVQRLGNGTVPTGAQACSVTSPAPGTVNPPRAGGTVQDQQNVAAGATSAVFDNLTDPNATYSFVVWGYNRAGCAVSAVASVLMRPAPGPVTDVAGGMTQRGDATNAAWDYQVTGISPNFHHYLLRAKGDTGDGVAFSAGAWPREVLGGAFGSTVAFEVRGCTAWDACGPWFGKAAPEPSLTFTMTGLLYDAGTGIFAWTNGPANGALAAGYKCFADADPAALGTATDPERACSIPTAPTTGPVHLVVTVNGHDFTYDK